MREKTKAIKFFLLLFVTLAQPAFAQPIQQTVFHNGGVGKCTGCHTIHRAPSIANGSATESGPYLLRASDQGSTCLNCHQAANLPGPTEPFISTPDTEMPAGVPPKQMTPGGDFGWLKKTYTWMSGTTTMTDPGYMHGHDIVAVDYGYAANPVMTKAPGGTFPAADLTCVSCHDPHGEYRRTVNGTIVSDALQNACASGSYNTSPDPTPNCPVGDYRLLGGIGYSQMGVNQPFTYGPPVAVAPSDYNRSEAVTQTRVAYGEGMSEWCANCHPAFLNSNPNTLSASRHPAGNGAKLGFIAKNYNMYVKTGDLSGTVETSYLSLVPFEEGTSNYDTLKAHAKTDDSYLAGPNADSNVMCLTCHRAHASGWDYNLRFNPFQTFLTADPAGQPVWPGTDVPGDASQAMGRTSAETSRAYYDFPASKFSPYQRSLCNKCHLQD